MFFTEENYVEGKLNEEIFLEDQDKIKNRY